MEKLKVDELIKYLVEQGYSIEGEDFNTVLKWAIEEQEKPRGKQFIQAIKEKIDLCDYDRWQHLQNLIFRNDTDEISLKSAFEIIDILYEKEDIEVLEISSYKE